MQIVYNLSMRTVGQILKEERERQFYNLSDIEKVTKIRIELLQALEADDYDKLPSVTFIQGFIKNYGRFLKLDSEKLLAIFRRGYSNRQHPPRILESFQNPLDKKRFRITPAKFISTVVIILLLVFFAYLWFEYRFLVGPPALDILSPQNNISTQAQSIEIKGRTNPETKVTINNQEVSVDTLGNFSEEIKLNENINKITITAISKFNQTAKEERVVYLKE